MRRDNCLLVKNVVTTSLEKMLIEKVGSDNMLTGTISCADHTTRSRAALCTAVVLMVVLDSHIISCSMQL